MKKRSQTSLAIPEALLALFLVGIIGFTGWFVLHAKQNADVSLNNSANSNQKVVKSIPKTTTESTGSYTDPVGNFSFTYPTGWKLTQTIDSDTRGKNSVVTVADPTGKFIVHFGADMGGRGGDCQPKASDVPFKAGNDCYSFEYLSSEVLPIKSVYYAKDTSSATTIVKPTYEPTTIVLATYHFAERDGKQSYGIGVTNSNPDNQVQVNRPSMGLFSDQEFVTVFNSQGTFKPYVYAYATGDSQSFLTGTTSDTIKTIFRSLKINP